MRILLLCILFVFCCRLPARAADVLILQSAGGPAYTEALRGFHALSKASYRTTLLSEYTELDLEQLVKEERPRLVLAVGDRAVNASRKLREVPVVALLSLALNLGKHCAENLGGVAMVAAPEQYLKLVASLGAKSVGILYDPAKTGLYVRRIGSLSKQAGLALVAEAVKTPRELQEKLERMKGGVDAIWVLPDSTVVTALNMEALLLFAMNNGLPVITFSSQYLNSGAAASLDVDYFDLGQQAGELATSVLANDATRRVPILDPRKAQLRANESVFRKLGRSISGVSPTSFRRDLD